MTPEQQQRLAALLSKPELSAAENTELGTLRAAAASSGFTIQVAAAGASTPPVIDAADPDKRLSIGEQLNAAITSKAHLNRDLAAAREEVTQLKADLAARGDITAADLATLKASCAADKQLFADEQAAHLTTRTELDQAKAKIAGLTGEAKSAEQRAVDKVAELGMKSEDAPPPSADAKSTADHLAAYNAITDPLERGRYFSLHEKEIFGEA